MPLGQFRDTFIIAVDEDGIAIIDQHVAHERVLFERITERLTSGRLESQRLLEPMLVEMSAAGARRWSAHAAELSVSGSRSRSSVATRCASPPFRRCSRARTATSRCARSPRTSKGWIGDRKSKRRSNELPRRWRVTPQSRRTTR